jgi:hypothetical protein
LLGAGGRREGTPAEHLVLAALGPEPLALAGQRTAGAHRLKLMGAEIIPAAPSSNRATGGLAAAYRR